MKVAIIGNPGYIKNSFLKSSEQIFREVGLNTGNLAFWYAVNSHILDEKTYLNWEFDPEYVNKNFDRLIFVGANQLNPAWDMSHLANKFEKVNIPMLVIGLGAQAEFGHDIYEQQEGTIRFMKAIGEKCSHISVRGELTKKVLAKYGIDNVVVTGCPSNFINPRKDIGIKANPKSVNVEQIKKIVFNIDIVHKLKDFLPLAYEWSRGLDDFSFVSQAPIDIVTAARSNDIYKDTKRLNQIRNLLMPGASLKYTSMFINRSFRSYFNAEMWMESLLHYDFSIGTRMHGNMLAFQVGVPTVFVAHDQRVLEMFTTMKLPYVLIEDILKGKNINNIVKHVTYDEDQYRKTRIKLCTSYIDILKENDISISKDLESILID